MFPSSYSNIDLPDHDKMFVTNYYDENPNLLANSEEDGFILSQLLSQSESHEVISNIGQSSSFCNNKEKEKVISVTSKSRKKGRHSKICTAQGTRDRRMRLSLQIARKFFDLQDMLGFDKASQTIEWLFSKSKSAIKDLKDTLSPPVGNSYSYATTTEEQVLKDEKRTSLMRKSFTSRMVGKESRDKARERARERTREKLKSKMLIEQQQPPPPQEEEEEEEENEDLLQAINIHQLVEDDEKMIKEQFMGVLRAERSFLEQNGGNSEDDFLGFSQIENNSDFLQKYFCFSYPAETNVKQQPLNMQVQDPSEIVLATSSRNDELKSDTSNFPNNNIIPFSSQTQNPSPFFMIASYNCSSQQHNPNSSFIPSTLIGHEEQNMANSSSVFLESQFVDGQFHCNSASSYKNGTFY